MSPDDLPREPEMPFTRGELAVMWICIFFPGIAGALIYAGYLEWIYPRVPLRGLWQGILVFSFIALLTLATCVFAGYIKACKSGRTKLISRSLRHGFAFLVGQTLIAPVVFVLLLFAIYRF